MLSVFRVIQMLYTADEYLKQIVVEILLLTFSFEEHSDVEFFFLLNKINVLLTNERNNLF